MAKPECSVCGLVKLPSEFLDEDLTPACRRHFRSACMQCTYEHASETSQCITCSAPIETTRRDYLRSCLDKLSVALPPASHEEGGDHIFVTRMDGSRRMFLFQANMTVRELKLKIQGTMKIEANKFRLLFSRGNKELRVSSKFSSDRMQNFCHACS
jgi:hypothetical protein